MGDFNLPKIDWVHESCVENESNINFKFLNLIHEHF